LGLLSERAIVVTGAARGLGRCYALDAAAEGASVVVNDLDEAGAAAVVEEVRAAGGRAAIHTESVTSWQGAENLFVVCREAFGRVDGLVNNAGVLYPASGREEEEANARKMIEVNVLGAVFPGTHAMRIFSEQGHGAIVNNTSAAAMGVTGLATYSATKGALLSLTYSWAVDMRPFGVRVNAFSPAARTRLGDASKKPLAVLAPPPHQNAPAVTYLLSDAAAGITGQVIQLDGESLVVIAPPAITTHLVTNPAWTAAAVLQQLDPVLRANLQAVGWANSLALDS
jgi:NAD(P)-dependent dehydrogenase (short-subunit alcohol dehydrogenase family)